MLWKPIKGYEGLYEVSNTGLVRSIITTTGRRKGLIKPHCKNGYLAVNLHKNSKLKHFYVHRLVASAFINNPNHLTEVNHIDCNKCNNNVENLEWCNRNYNLQHSYNHGLKRFGEKHGGHKLTEKEVLQIINEYVKNDKEHSLYALAKKYGVNWCTIQAIVTGRLWKHIKRG